MLIFTILSGLAFSQELSVDSDVMCGCRSPFYVEYNGSYESGQIATGSQIRETGRSLGRVIHAHEDDETPLAKGNPAYKYSAGRVYGKDKAGADILYLGESVGVNTIKCLRLIVSGYVQEAFSCSQTESDLIAAAVCDWNANHYLDSAYFEKRYDTRIFSLFSERCTNIGLSSDYHDWPNSRIVIPHKSAGSAFMNSSFVSEVLASEDELFSKDGDSQLSDDSENDAIESEADLFPSAETDADSISRNVGLKDEWHKKKWPWWLLLLLLILIVIFLLIRFLNNGESGHVSVEKGFSVSNTVQRHDSKKSGVKTKNRLSHVGIVESAALCSSFDANMESSENEVCGDEKVERTKEPDKSGDEKIHFYTTKEERMKHIPHEIYKDGDKKGEPWGTWSGEPGNSMFIPADTPENQEIIKYLHEHGIEGIEYKDGVPDFSPVSEGTVEIPDMTEYRSYFNPRPDGKPGNYEQAYQALADKWNKEKRGGRDNWTADDIRKWAKPRNIPKNYKLEVHENSDTKTCEFIRHDIHMFFKHSGGREECKIRDKENGRWNNKDNNGGFDE